MLIFGMPISISEIDTEYKKKVQQIYWRHAGHVAKRKLPLEKWAKQEN